MARDSFKEQVATEEASELVERLGYTLAKSHATRQARKATSNDEKLAWGMIARRIRPDSTPAEPDGFDDEPKSAEDGSEAP